jgi:hypothetical protein
MDKLNKTYGTGSRTRSANNRRLLSVQEYWFYYVTLGVVDLLKKMYELMGWEELVTTICGHATAECQKQVELFYIDGRMLLIKIFSRIRY